MGNVLKELTMERNLLISGNEKKYNGSYLVDIEDKSHQWFGATVVSHEDLIVVSCHNGPRKQRDE